MNIQGLTKSTFSKLTVLGLALVLSACGGKQNDLHKYVEQTLKRPGGKIEPLPKVVEYEPYRYASASLRNPFETPRKVAKNNIQPDTKRPKEELEAYSIDSLQMVGTFVRNNKIWALISAPNGSLYKVVVGNYMGKNYGRIDKINKDFVELIETVPDGQGGWVQQRLKLDLTNKEKTS